MNILVVGNGFDIAHKLPTGYKDFLRFTEVFNDYEINRKCSLYLSNDADENRKEEQLVEYVKRLIKRKDTDEQAKNLVAELKALISDNTWINYFKNINIAQGWIDFENQISHVIRILDQVRIKSIEGIQRKGEGDYIFSYEREVLAPFLGELSYITDIKVIQKLKEVLLEDLNRLTRCLEIYLSDYVENIIVERKLPDIEELDVHAVVSFNYTDTYKSVYMNSTKKIKYDFIHGKAQISHTKESCNMVLGIDEYLCGEARDSDNEFIRFKKFYQRIYKGTGCEYINWLEEIKARPEEKYFPRESNVYIYGHSLDVADKDILRTLIMSENVKTTIFYHSQEALGEQISNLVKVITEDELIRRTGKKNIIFKKIKGDK